jgi:hypothetical protein
MAHADFDAKLAKLQAKILEDIGEPVPADVREAAARAVLGAGTRLEGPRHKDKVVVKVQPNKLRTYGRSGPKWFVRDASRSKPTVIPAVVEFEAGVRDRAKIRRQGNEVIVTLADAASAQGVIGEIQANKVVEIESVEKFGPSTYLLARAKNERDTRL